MWPDKSGMIYYSALLGIIRVLFAAQPGRMLRWTIRNHPDVADNQGALVIARLIGVGLLAMTLFIVEKL
jgi:hypothetical protein